MDQIIRKNANAGVLMYPADFKKLSNAKVSWHHFDRPYFFFERELSILAETDEKHYQDVKTHSIRHLVPYKGRYFDYITHKEYDSLSQWASANGEALDNILYGVVKKHRAHASKPVVVYVRLDKLIQYLDPDYNIKPTIEIPEVPSMEALLAEFDDALQQLSRIRQRIQNHH